METYNGDFEEHNRHFGKRAPSKRTPEHVARWERIHADMGAPGGRPYKYAWSTGPEPKQDREIPMLLPHNTWVDWELDAVLFINDIRGEL